MSLDESLAARKMAMASTPASADPRPNSEDHTLQVELLTELKAAMVEQHNENYAQHQRFMTEMAEAFKTFKSELNGEAAHQWQESQRILAEKSLNAALRAAQDSAVAIIHKETAECMHELRKMLQEHGLTSPLMDPAKSPQILGDHPRRPIPWLWVAAWASVGVLVIVSLFVFHIFH